MGAGKFAPEEVPQLFPLNREFFSKPLVTPGDLRDVARHGHAEHLFVALKL